MPFVRIKLKSYSFKGDGGLYKTLYYLIGLIKKSGSKFNNPVFLPVKIRKYYYIKAPQIYSRHGQHLEKRIFSVIIDIMMNKSLEDLLIKSDLPGGVLAYVNTNFLNKKL